MKNIVLFFHFFLFFNCFALLSQSCYYYVSLTFEEDYDCLDHLYIDTVSNPTNIWQIGSPQKQVFNAGVSQPNVLITDTINPYPINDTSSFVIAVISNGGMQYNHTTTLSGYYFVDSDTLNDFGMIEFSPDNGTTWIDIINDTVYNLTQNWDTEPPVLTGQSNEWKYFQINLSQLGQYFAVTFDDTLLYKFTFISDSVHSGKDGLMFDSFYLEDYVEGINELNAVTIPVITHPNPASNKITFSFSNPEMIEFRLSILDNQGREVFSKNITSDETIEPLNFDSGLYTYRMLSKDQTKVATGKIVIELRGELYFFKIYSINNFTSSSFF